MSESITPARAVSESPTALVLLVIGLTLVAALVPFAFLVCAPALLVTGARMLHSGERGGTRIVGWAALALGAMALLVPAVAVLGLVAVGADPTIVETAPR